MDAETRALVGLSAALAAGGRDRLERALDRARTDAAPEAVEEALLQSYLFLGYPAALRALALWRERTGRPAPRAAADGWAEWRRRGEAVCARVYGGQYGRLRENIARLHPDLERWMLVEGYGKVLGRPGLDLKTRELCIVGLLAAQDARPQLYAHLRGALNAGAAPAEVEAALAEAGGWLDAVSARAAAEVWAELQRRRDRGPGGTDAEVGG